MFLASMGFRTGAWAPLLGVLGLDPIMLSSISEVISGLTDSSDSYVQGSALHCAGEGVLSLLPEVLCFHKFPYLVLP